MRHWTNKIKEDFKDIPNIEQFIIHNVRRITLEKIAEEQGIDEAKKRGGHSNLSTLFHYVRRHFVVKEELPDEDLPQDFFIEEASGSENSDNGDASEPEEEDIDIPQFTLEEELKLEELTKKAK